jgi:glycine cleavage system pyridoxal-binding protein P
MDYIQITAKQREEMLKTVGAARIDDLLRQVPAEYRLTKPLNIPGPMDEQTLRAHLAFTGGAESIDGQSSLLPGRGLL